MRRSGLPGARNRSVHLFESGVSRTRDECRVSDPDVDGVVVGGVGEDDGTTGEGLMTGVVWPPGSRSRTVDLDGRVHLTEYGEPDAAKLMICLHGLGGSALNFGLTAPLMTHGRRVLVPDLLGHGRSFATAPDASAVDAQLQMLERLLTLEAERPVTLVGHSMGAIVAMLHVLGRPETVQGLVLLDPPVPNTTRWSRDPRLTTKLAFLRLPGVAALVARQVARMSPQELVARQLADATPQRRPDPGDGHRRHRRGDQGHQERRRRSASSAFPVPRDPRGGGAPRPSGAVEPRPGRHHHADPVVARRGRPAVGARGCNRARVGTPGVDLPDPRRGRAPASPRGPHVDSALHHGVAGRTDAASSRP